jgi:hypothetical protein
MMIHNLLPIEIYDIEARFLMQNKKTGNTNLLSINYWLPVLLLLSPIIISTNASANSKLPLPSLPLFSIDQLEYVGAFRVPTGDYGDSRFSYAQGPITLGKEGKSLFIVGHAQHQAIAEISIPQLIISKDIKKLQKASIIQKFSKVLDRPQTGNPQNINIITGMKYFKEKLIVNGLNYYDANNSVYHTTLVVDEAKNLNISTVSGYHQYQSRAHGSGWISSIPIAWQKLLNADHIIGNSSGSPIISRHSVGPSAFAINLEENILNVSSPSVIKEVPLLNYSLSNPMGKQRGKSGDYLTNKNTNNKLWTHLSQAVYGFIVPGTNTYITLGYSGGHESGVGYKITPQGAKSECPGYCGKDVKDNYNFFWLFNMKELLNVVEGSVSSYEVLPYNYGIFKSPFENTTHHKIKGGAYDSQHNLLYLTLDKVDHLQSQYEKLPIIAAYRIKLRT